MQAAVSYQLVQIELKAWVMDAGDVEAAEVVHLFVAPSPVLLGAAAGNALPQKTLKGFARIVVKPGQHQAVELPLASKDFQFASSGATQLCTKPTAAAEYHCCHGAVMILNAGQMPKADDINWCHLVLSISTPARICDVSCLWADPVMNMCCHTNA